jgi:hypothetical protein
MIKFENLDEWGFEHAIRGMRNPLNSWDRSDSMPGGDAGYQIGENDLKLMKRLYNNGPEHRKYLRQIMVSVDITAPLYWWKEFDTYKVGTTANSCSTMHKITSKVFTTEDFSVEDVTGGSCGCILDVIKWLNYNRDMYLETKDKKYWRNIIQILPSSYNQKRTITMSYENIVNMLHQRANHKLTEWHEFCDYFENNLKVLKLIRTN